MIKLSYTIGGKVRIVLLVVLVELVPASCWVESNSDMDLSSISIGPTEVRGSTLTGTGGTLEVVNGEEEKYVGALQASRDGL